MEDLILLNIFLLQTLHIKLGFLDDLLLAPIFLFLAIFHIVLSQFATVAKIITPITPSPIFRVMVIQNPASSSCFSSICAINVGYYLSHCLE